MNALVWPDESASKPIHPVLVHQGSNLCLDLHGDPLRAKLAVFSDGNHHMALEECLQGFVREHPLVSDVFYSTMPPRLAIEALQAGGIRVGNLSLTIRPQLVISPPSVLDRLVQLGFMKEHRPFVRSRGSVLLVKKGNPAAIHDIADLARAGVRLFISNPKTETVSYSGYAETLSRLAAARGIRLPTGSDGAAPRMVFGETIHHREAPEAVAAERADAAIVYFHLALRYVRIFPDLFEIVPLAEAGDPDNLRTTIHIGLADDPGEWGVRALDYLTGPACATVYSHHGLDRAP